MHVLTQRFVSAFRWATPSVLERLSWTGPIVVGLLAFLSTMSSASPTSGQGQPPEQKPGLSPTAQTKVDAPATARARPPGSWQSAPPRAARGDAAWGTDPVEDEPAPSPVRSKRKRHSAALLFNPIAMAMGDLTLDLGIGLSQGVSLNLLGEYVSDPAFEGYTAGLGMQFFPSGRLYNGWFFYPQALYLPLTVNDVPPDNTDVDVDVFGLGALAGYHWSWTLFSLRLGLGAIYFTGTTKNTAELVSFSGTLPRLDISLGFAL